MLKLVYNYKNVLVQTFNGKDLLKRCTTRMETEKASFSRNWIFTGNFPVKGKAKRSSRREDQLK